MTNYKRKYLKYKLKLESLNAKNNQKGGTIVLDIEDKNGNWRELKEFFDNSPEGQLAIGADYLARIYNLDTFLNFSANSNEDLLPAPNGNEEYGHTEFNWRWGIGYGHRNPPATTWNPREVDWLNYFVTQYDNIHEYIVHELHQLKINHDGDTLFKEILSRIFLIYPVTREQINNNDATRFKFSPWGIKHINFKNRRIVNENYLKPLKMRQGLKDRYISIDTTAFMENQYKTFIEDLLYMRHQLFNLKLYEYTGEPVLLHADNYDYYLKQGNVLYYDEENQELHIDDNIFNINKGSFRILENKCELLINDLCNGITIVLRNLRDNLEFFRDNGNSNRIANGSALIKKFGEEREKYINNTLIPLFNNGFTNELDQIHGLNTLGTVALNPDSLENKYQILINELNKNKTDSTRIDIQQDEHSITSNKVLEYEKMMEELRSEISNYDDLYKVNVQQFESKIIDINELIDKINKLGEDVKQNIDNLKERNDHYTVIVEAKEQLDDKYAAYRLNIHNFTVEEQFELIRDVNVEMENLLKLLNELEEYYIPASKIRRLREDTNDLLKKYKKEKLNITKSLDDFIKDFGKITVDKKKDTALRGFFYIEDAGKKLYLLDVTNTDNEPNKNNLYVFYDLINSKKIIINYNEFFNLITSNSLKKNIKNNKKNANNALV